jgi:hypothetical protein
MALTSGSECPIRDYGPAESNSAGPLVASADLDLHRLANAHGLRESQRLPPNLSNRFKFSRAPLVVSNLVR